MGHSRHYQIYKQSQPLLHKFLIFNDNNDVIYTIYSKSDKFDDKLTLIDSSNNELVKFFLEDPHLHLTYIISSVDNENNHLATIRRTGLPGHRKFKIDSLYGKYTISRTRRLSSNHEYEVFKNDNKIAHFNQKDLKLDDSYPVDIDASISEREDLFILAYAVILQCSQDVHFIGHSE